MEEESIVVEDMRKYGQRRRQVLPDMDRGVTIAAGCSSGATETWRSSTRVAGRPTSFMARRPKNENKDDYCFYYMVSVTQSS